MKYLERYTPKEKRDEIVAAYLGGENSYQELGDYYNVSPNTITQWVHRYRKSKKAVSLQAECLWTLFGGFAPPAARQTTAVFFIVVNSFRKKSTFSVKVSTIPVKWSTCSGTTVNQIRKRERQVLRYSVTVLQLKTTIPKSQKLNPIFIYI